MEPIRVLYIVGGRLNYGGIETFIMNYYRNIDKTKVQIDFIVNGYEKGVYDDEIKSMGGKIYNVPQRGKHFFKHKKEIKKILKTGKYKIVHAHANHLNGLFLSIAKRCNVPVRISHSHTADFVYDNKMKKIIFNIYKQKVKKCATEYWTCSRLAGEWLYGKKNQQNQKVILVKNAIELEKYKFNEEKRKRLRKLYNLKDEKVIGNIGRFSAQKNHEFIIELFKKYYEQNSNSKLVLIGEGPLKDKIKNKIVREKLENAIIIIDRANNINEILNMFDIFILPSLYEGLPFVAIEAQANNLPCIFSEGVTKETKINSNVCFTKLDVDIWIKKLQEYLGKQRKIDLDNLKKMGYDIKVEAKKLERRYIKLYYDERKTNE